MRTAIGVLAILSLGSSMLALAEEPTTPPAAPQAATAPAAPEGTTPNAPAAPAGEASAAAPAAPASDAPPQVAHAQGATTPGNSSAPAPAAGTMGLTDEDRSFIRRGYQIEMKKGEKYYCREQQTMGSRVNKKRVCMRPDQMDQLRENAQDNMREKVRNNKFEG